MKIIIILWFIIFVLISIINWTMIWSYDGIIKYTLCWWWRKWNKKIISIHKNNFFNYQFGFIFFSINLHWFLKSKNGKNKTIDFKSVDNFLLSFLSHQSKYSSTAFYIFFSLQLAFNLLLSWKSFQKAISNLSFNKAKASPSQVTITKNLPTLLIMKRIILK